jgi:hypothetical protein
LVDEDCFSGGRREGTLFGAISLAQNIAAALCSSMAQINIAAFGFKTRNCEDDCEFFDGEHADCMDVCYREMVAMQPDGFRTYCKLAIGLIAPLCELLVAYHAFTFPIKGMRLRRIYHQTMANNGDESYLESPTSAQGNVMSRTSKNLASSKIALVIDSLDQVVEENWKEHLNIVVKNLSEGFADKTNKSCAVIFETLEDFQPPSPRQTTPSWRPSVRTCYSQKADAELVKNGKDLDNEASDLPSDTKKDSPKTNHVEPTFSDGATGNGQQSSLHWIC